MRPAGLSSETDEKLIELVRKCDELYDIAHKKYSDSVWKEKLWGQNMMVQRKKRSRLRPVQKNKFENKIFRGTKRATYQPETASAELMTYLVESYKERQAEPPIYPSDAFFKSTAATVKTFSPYHQNFCKSRIFEIVSEVGVTEILKETKSTHSSEYSFGSPDEAEIQ